MVMQDDFRPQRPGRRPEYTPRQYSTPQQPVPPGLPPEYEEDEPRNTGVKVAFASISLLFVLVLAGGGFWMYRSMNKSNQLASAGGETKGEQNETPQGLELVQGKHYGNKYANGILPVGDNKYVTDGARKGNVYLCKPNFAKQDKTARAVPGPWFAGDGRWDSNKKMRVSGEEQWQNSVHTAVANGRRTLQSSSLPNHPSGKFPATLLDPSYVYDRNPYSIKGLPLNATLDAEPEFSESPVCMGEEAGMMLNGVLLLNAFDQAGRDAEAWEVHDACDGHPHKSGIYHYHGLSRCFQNTGVETVLGFALDGFPITGPKVGKDNYLTTTDLDECHGIVSTINLDGKMVKTYHYVLTKDFPYTVSCFRNAKAFSGGSGEGLAPTDTNGAGGLEVQGSSGLRL